VRAEQLMVDGAGERVGFEVEAFVVNAELWTADVVLRFDVVREGGWR
jgi:hypothetical protein